ncbi:MAG: serine hydrolase [Thermoleophilia bacterium]|nr:serine hydrolase [Thermoleophilia bacterium]
MTNARDHVPLAPRPELPFAERIAALEAAFSGRLGFHALHLGSGEELELRADERFPTASVIKVALVATLLDLVAAGEADLAELAALPPPGRRVVGGGILKQLELDRISLRDACELTIVLSDNVATNVVLDRCGGHERVNAYLDRAGLPQTRLLGPVDFSRIGPGLEGGIGISTPREQTRLLAGLERRELLTPDLCRYLLGVLGRQHYSDQLPRWLGWNTYAQYHGRDWPLWVGNKTGELDGIRADVGLVRSAAATVALAIFTDGSRDTRETVDAEGSLAVAECSAAICARLLGLAA